VSSRSRLVTAGSRVRLRLAGDDRLVAYIRRGEIGAFEALYDRHATDLLSFCVYMLGSRQDAEDAVQASYASVYRALLADGRPVTLRPWLFTIARNECLSILRRRRPTVELNGEAALTGDPARHVEVREDMRQMLDGIRRLPETQRAALVLAEVHGLSQADIASVLGVRTEQVKAYIYQARSNLLSERRAREADCSEIRKELAAASGAALLRGRLRRHVRSCAGCRAYAAGVTRQHRQLGALMPTAPMFALKYRALEEALSIGAADPATCAGGAAVGASVAGAAAEVAGGGIKALVIKVAAGVAAMGASAGVGVSVLTAPAVPNARHAAAVRSARAQLTASDGPRGPALHTLEASSYLAAGDGGLEVSSNGTAPAAAGVQQGTQAPSGGADAPAGRPGEGGSGPRVGGGSPPTGAERRRSEREERLASSGATGGGEEERQVKRLEREQDREEHAQQREARQRLHEERQSDGSSRSPQSEEERLRRREERHQPGGVSRSPQSEEERLRKREERHQPGGLSRSPQSKEERQLEREERRSRHEERLREHEERQRKREEK
jgi:RNA polymerase sigma factor (sigma-70 family)